MLNNIHSALACCGCLLAVNEEEFTVQVIHHSVKQYILGGLDGVKHMSFSFEDAERTLADTVVTYLGYGVFGTELSRRTVHPTVAQSAPLKIVRATIGPTACDAATWILGLRQESEFDMSKALAEARSSFNPSPKHKFRFYTYAKTHWRDHVLCVSGDKAAIFRLASKLIFARASELNEVDMNYWTRFQRAAENGRRNVLELLLQAGKIDTNVSDSDGATPLMQAARDGHKDTVEVLLTIGKADVYLRDKDGWTALIWAAANGHKDTVKVLLTVGKACVNLRDNDGWLPLMWAAADGHKDVVEVLLTIGKAEVNLTDKDGRTPTIRAAANGHKDTVEVLLTVGKAFVNVRDKDGWTALMWAAANGHKDVVEVLLTVGKAVVNVRDKDGSTSILRAAANGHEDVVEVLLGKDFVNVRDKDGWTALMQAAADGHEDKVNVPLKTSEAVSYMENKDKLPSRPTSGRGRRFLDGRAPTLVGDAAWRDYSPKLR
jgi:ankyrin repeat protein